MAIAKLNPGVNLPGQPIVVGSDLFVGREEWQIADVAVDVKETGPTKAIGTVRGNPAWRGELAMGRYELRVTNELPQPQVTLVSTYLGWMPCFMSRFLAWGKSTRRCHTSAACLAQGNQ